MSIAVDGYEEASAHAKAWQAAFQQTQDEALAQTSVFAVTVNVEPTWSSVDLVNRFMSLVIRLMNFDSMVIFEEPESFEPLFIEREWQDKTALVIDEWCEAYLRGVELTGESWAAGGSDIANLMIPSLGFRQAARRSSTAVRIEGIGGAEEDRTPDLRIAKNKLGS